MRVCSENMKAYPTVYITAPIDRQHPSCPKGLNQDGLCTKKVLCIKLVPGVPIKKKMNAVMKTFGIPIGKNSKIAYE